MRMVAQHVERKTIGKFLDYLKTRGIGAEIRPFDSAWSLWVYHEDACREARNEYETFLSDPDAARYDVAPEVMELTAARPPAPVSRTPVRWAIARQGFLHGTGPVTLVLLLVSLAATLPVLLDRSTGEWVVQGLRADGRVVRQWWRLFTPAFLHFSWLHIIFNMLWLRDLGGMLERIKGPRFLLCFFLVTAGVSNYAQFVAGDGHLFGGMSGVVYGLFGYVAIKSRMAPDAGFHMESATVMMLMLWFFLGWTGAVGPIANWAHGFGLGTGVALALAPGKRPIAMPE